MSLDTFTGVLGIGLVEKFGGGSQATRFKFHTGCGAVAEDFEREVTVGCGQTLTVKVSKFCSGSPWFRDLAPVRRFLTPETACKVRSGIPANRGLKDADSGDSLVTVNSQSPSRSSHLHHAGASDVRVCWGAACGEAVQPLSVEGGRSSCLLRRGPGKVRSPGGAPSRCRVIHAGTQR